MPTNPEWSDIAIRILCALLAGAMIGFDRGEHGRPAGLRTMILVTLAACLSMIQANILLPTSGKGPASFVQLDVMRLPLGILSGMGFIGAGAILRRDNLVVGVTTAATLWFVTVLGLCFGGGQILLGFAGLAIGLMVLTVLRRVENRMRQDRQGKLVIATSEAGPSETEVLDDLRRERFIIVSCAVVYSPQSGGREITYDVRWSAQANEVRVPEAVRSLSDHEGVVKVAWTPQGK